MRHQKTILSYWTLVFYLVIITFTLNAKRVNEAMLVLCLFIMVLFYIFIPYIYDLFQERGDVFNVGTRAGIEKFYRYSLCSFVVFLIFLISTSFIMSSFSLGRNYDAMTFFSFILLLGGISVTFINREDNSKRRMLFLNIVLVSMLIVSQAPYRISQKFFDEMRLINYTINSASFKNRHVCGIFYDKFFEKSNKKQCVNNKITFNKELLIVLSSIENQNHLLKYGGNIYRFKKEWIKLERKTFEKKKEAFFGCHI